MMDTNYFARLNQINVSEHLEMKGSFSYLSWPYAVAQLRLADPTAFWNVRRFDGLPYLKTEAGYFVEVAVTVQGICLSQVHPVLDGKNRPLSEPTCFDINTSIQRCLVKAIALHGLGLYIYAGEDLPDGEAAKPVPPKASVAAITSAKMAQVPQRFGNGDRPRDLPVDYAVSALATEAQPGGAGGQPSNASGNASRAGRSGCL
jgi:Protein of unknown function (DUF1071)